MGSSRRPFERLWGHPNKCKQNTLPQRQLQLVVPSQSPRVAPKQKRGKKETKGKIHQPQLTAQPPLLSALGLLAAKLLLFLSIADGSILVPWTSLANFLHLIPTSSLEAAGRVLGTMETICKFLARSLHIGDPQETKVSESIGY